MQIFKTALLTASLFFFFGHLHAQNPAAKKPATGFQKIKPPKLQTILEGYKDSVAVTAEVAEKIISMPLKIYDDKKNEYQISSYQFLYKKKGVTEDEKTGNVTPTTTVSSNLFKVTPLPELWINLIKQQVKPGEEFFFFAVIAKDSQGRVMYAPDLKIVVR